MKVSFMPLLVHGVAVTQVHQANEQLYLDYTNVTSYLPTSGMLHASPQLGESLFVFLSIQQ